MDNDIIQKITELFDKARLLEEQKRIPEALSTYLNILKIFPHHVSALNNTAAIFAEYYNNPKSALECYNQAIRNDPKNVASIIGKGSLMVTLQNSDDAMLYYKAALKVESKNIDAKIGIANLRLLNGENELGLKMLNEILEIDPNNIQALYNKATLLGMMDDLDTSIELFDKILEKDPTNQAAIYNKSYAEFLQNRKTRE